MTNFHSVKESVQTVPNRPPVWSESDLLEQHGIFFLDDVAQVLPVDVRKLKRDARRIKRQGGSPWRELGLRKVFNQWVVRMPVFRDYYGRD